MKCSMYKKLFVFHAMSFISSFHHLELIDVQVASPSELARMNVLLHNNRADGLVPANLAPGFGIMAACYGRRSTAIGSGILNALGREVVLLGALVAVGTGGGTSPTLATAALVGSSRGRLSHRRGSSSGRLSWGRWG